MEEELLMLKSNGLLSCEERQEEMKQMEVYRSHTKFMKNKVRCLIQLRVFIVPTSPSPHAEICFFQMEQVKQDLSRKDTELLGLQTKLETLTNQFSDSKQHIEVLKESLTAKEQRAAILQTEVQDLGPSVQRVDTTGRSEFLSLCFPGGCFTPAFGRKGGNSKQEEQTDSRNFRREGHPQRRNPRPQRHAGGQGA